MKKITFLATALIVSYFANAQVLLSEDFNSYPAGHLHTDYTGTTPGQGGWVIKRSNNANATAMITPETGKGNVVTFTTNSTLNENISIQQAIDALWNNRTAGNNVLKFEYEVYGTGFFIAEGSIWDNAINFINLRFLATSGHRIEARTVGSGPTNQILQSYTSSTFPYNTWHKVELFFDYNGK